MNSFGEISKDTFYSLPMMIMLLMHDDVCTETGRDACAHH